MEIASAIIMMLGGLAMFLYGVEVMGDGLKNSSGTALKRILEKVTGNVLLGVLTGALVTAVIQSSTATIVLTVALVGAGVLSLKQAVSIVMGANIGTTVTAQIIRLSAIDAGDSWFLWFFDTDTLAPIALFLGILLLLFIKKKNAKPVGDIFIGVGVLFIGLKLMTEGVEPLVGTSFFASFVKWLENPLVGILVGLVLTVIVQSSAATVGMLQTVAQTAVATGAVTVTFAMAYPVIMGINIGTCVTTAIVCSIGTGKDAKRVGVVHIAFNVIGTVLFMAVMLLLQKYHVFGSEFWNASVDSGGIANFQTVFNVVTAAVLIPFNGLLVKLSTWIVKEEPEHIHRHPELHTLDERLYISPSVALAEGTKAVAFMGGIARDNFQRCTDALLTQDFSHKEKIVSEEDCLDKFCDVSDPYFIGLSKRMEKESDDRQLDLLLQTVPSFERVGDYGTNLLELAESMAQEKVHFSAVAQEELKLLCQAVNEILQITVAAFGENDNRAATRIEPLEETVDDMVMILRDRHTKRLKSGECTVASGLPFMDSLTHLERVADHCSAIAVMMLSRENEAILQNHYEYLRQLHAGTDRDYQAERALRRRQYIDPLYKL